MCMHWMIKVSSITYVYLNNFSGNISTRGFRDERMNQEVEGRVLMKKTRGKLSRVSGTFRKKEVFYLFSLTVLTHIPLLQ
jgi:hypothetical protein